MSRGPLLSLTGESLTYRDTWVMQYHGESYLVKASAPGTQRTVPWPPKGPRAPFEKPWVRSYRVNLINLSRKQGSGGNFNFFTGDCGVS